MLVNHCGTSLRNIFRWCQSESLSKHSLRRFYLVYDIQWFFLYFFLSGSLTTFGINGLKWNSENFDLIRKKVFLFFPFNPTLNVSTTVKLKQQKDMWYAIRLHLYLINISWQFPLASKAVYREGVRPWVLRSYYQLPRENESLAAADGEVSHPSEFAPTEFTPKTNSLCTFRLPCLNNR